MTIKKIIDYVKMIKLLETTNKTTENNDDSYKDIDNKIIVGVAIATCCHYLLSGKSFINETLFKSFGINEEELEWITKITWWSILKNVKEEERKKHCAM